MPIAEELPTQSASCPCVVGAAGDDDDGVSTFMDVRSRLYGIAYRILGGAPEAEDIVQDVWLRWQCTDRSVVENPTAFLATITARLCINLLQSAQTRRETYIGNWFREPAVPSVDPGLGVERGQALTLAVRVLFETLSPKERAAYVLREVFEYSYREIAELVQTEEVNVRQLVSRARKRIADGRRVFAGSGELRHFLSAFIAGAREGDMSPLETLFAQGTASKTNGDAAMHLPHVPVAAGERHTSMAPLDDSDPWKGMKLAWLATNGRAIGLRAA